MLMRHSVQITLPEKRDKSVALFALAMAQTLRPAARAVGAVLVESFNSTTGRCFPSVPYICGCTDLGRSAVFQALNQLEDAKLIVRHTHAGPGGSTVYEVNWAEFAIIAEASRARGRRAREHSAIALKRREEESTNVDSEVHISVPPQSTPVDPNLRRKSSNKSSKLPAATEHRKSVRQELDDRLRKAVATNRAQQRLHTQITRYCQSSEDRSKAYEHLDEACIDQEIRTPWSGWKMLVTNMDAAAEIRLAA